MIGSACGGEADLQAVQAFAVAMSRVNGKAYVVDLGELTFIDSCGQEVCGRPATSTPVCVT